MDALEVTDEVFAPRHSIVFDPVVIAHVSDLHLGAHSAAAVDSLLSDLTAAAPALTIVTGDLTMRARHHQFVTARRVVDQLPGRVLVVLGNHDLPVNPVRRLPRPYERFLQYLPGPLDPLVEIPGVRALGLTSMPGWRWKSGRATPEQVDAVIRVLGPAPTGTLRVLALHHPPTAGGPAAVDPRRPGEPDDRRTS